MVHSKWPWHSTLASEMKSPPSLTPIKKVFQQRMAFKCKTDQENTFKHCNNSKKNRLCELQRTTLALRTDALRRGGQQWIRANEKHVCKAKSSIHLMMVKYSLQRFQVETFQDYFQLKVLVWKKKGRTVCEALLLISRLKRAWNRNSYILSGNRLYKAC